MIDAVLSEAGIGMSELDGLAFTLGPGSFTGIRIGFGVAQGLAFGAGLPVMPVSTLETMAIGALHRFNLQPGEYLLPMLDARMDEVYWALFQVTAEGRLNRLVDDSLSSPENVQFSLPKEGNLTVVGDGLNYAQVFTFPTPKAEVSAFYPSAASVLEIACREFAEGRQQQIEDVQPAYLRERVSWKKRQRLRN